MSYDACREALERVEAELSAAEFHGTLCALLCTRRPVRIEEWVDEIVACDEPGRGWSASLRAASERTQRALEAGDCNLRLLLPADDAPISERGAAFSQWCAGFLYGLGTAGSAAAARLSEEAREVVSDLVEFTRLDTDETASEETEAAFAEVTEYVRVGVLLIYEELMRAPASQTAEQPLH